MGTFSLILNDGNVIDGQTFFPHETATLPGLLGVPQPLLVVVHGGSYTASYFDADEKHSLRCVCERLGLCGLAINRPGYGSTTPLDHVDHGQDSFIRQSGRWLNELALPAIWEKFSTQIPISSIVLYGHSIGAAVSVVACGEYEKTKHLATYKLAGLALSGVGSKTPPNHKFELQFTEERKTHGPRPLTRMQSPLEQQINLMVGSSELHDPAILKQIERLHGPLYLQELFDIEVLWHEYWKSYAALVTLPVWYQPGKEDQLWVINEDTMAEFGSAFSNSTYVSLIMASGAPHAIELSLQSAGFYLGLMAFAIQSAVQLETTHRLRSNADGCDIDTSR